MARTRKKEELPDAVTVAYVHQNEAKMCWRQSIEALKQHDLVHYCRVIRGGELAIRSGTNGLTESRNLAVKTFLKEAKAPWMFWTDTDMGFEPDIVERLMEVADPVKRPMVGALCFSMRENGPDGMGGWRNAPTPTVFDWGEHEGKHGFIVRFNYDRFTVTRVAGTGSAAVLIHRSVFEKVQAEFGSKRPPQEWYDRITNPLTGQLIGEDLSFCMRLGALNIPMHVHTGVQASHEKTVWVTEETYIKERVWETWKAEQEAKANANANANGNGHVEEKKLEVVK